MNTIEEFGQVIEGDYKITNLTAYNEYKTAVGNRGITKEEVEKLSPDNVNSSSFWEYIEKNPEIKNDAIAFGIPREGTREDVNKSNFSLACSLNVFSPILSYRDAVNLPLLDIGAGYGMLKEFVEQNTKLKYFGVDVYPKIEGVTNVGHDGSTLPTNITDMKGQFGLVISVNVFQHLSIKQRRHYYEQIDHLLNTDYGVFVFTISCQVPNSNLRMRGFVCQETGREYLCHYGQYTEIQTYPEIMDDIMKHFNVMSVCQRGDYSFTFQCNAKKKL